MVVLLAAASSFRDPIFCCAVRAYVRVCSSLQPMFLWRHAFRVCFTPVAIAYVCGSLDEFHVLSPSMLCFNFRTVLQYLLKNDTARWFLVL